MLESGLKVKRRITEALWFNLCYRLLVCVWFWPLDCVFVYQQRGSAAVLTASGSAEAPAPPPPAGWSPSVVQGAAGCPDIASKHKHKFLAF